MGHLDERERREADLFYADLVGMRRPLRRRRAAARPGRAPGAEAYAPVTTGIDAGRVFDSVVHQGTHPSVLLASEAEDEGGSWETLARPSSVTSPQDLPRGALVIGRALGESRLACMRVLGYDIQVAQLYGADGRIRADILVLGRRGAARSPARWSAESVEAVETTEAAESREVVETAEAAESVEPGEAVETAETAEHTDGAEEMGPAEIVERAEQAARARQFPPRAGTALAGRAFMETIKGEGAPRDWVKREDAIVSELVAGNMPDALLRWVKVDLAYQDQQHSITGTLEVLPDYLSVGRNDDFVHVPLDPVSAQLVADRFDTILPTARICHAIYTQTPAKNRINAIERDYWSADAARKSAKRGRAQTSSAAYLEHSEAIQARMKAAGVTLGELVAGHKKDVVMARRLHSDADKIAFHGFYDKREYPHEPCYENPDRAPKPSCKKDSPTLAHTRRFSDYSQGVRLIHPWMIVNGERKMVADVLADPDLSHLLSSEGPIVPARIPKTVKPKPGPAESDADPGEADPASTASAVTIEAAPGLGSEHTVAPIANISPQRQMNEILDRELILFARARIVAEWIDRNFAATFDQAGADSALMARLDVSKDRALREKLRPFPQGRIPGKRGQLFTAEATLEDLLRPPTDAAGLWPIFDLLHFYDVVLLPSNPKAPSGRPSVLARITRVDARLTRARFDTESAAVEQRAVQWKRDVAGKGVLHHAVEAEAIPADWSAGKPGTTLKVARPVVALLRRLRERNRMWRAGTYPGHFWNDFSVDAFIIAGVNAGGFWARDKMRDFFRALNAASEQDATPGRFAWRALYNDVGLATEMDRLYGAGRVLHGIAGHGPGPDMHVHLDVRPLAVPFDATTGFRLHGSRVVLSPPAPSTAGSTTTGPPVPARN